MYCMAKTRIVYKSYKNTPRTKHTKLCSHDHTTIRAAINCAYKRNTDTIKGYKKTGDEYLLIGTKRRRQ